MTTTVTRAARRSLLLVCTALVFAANGSHVSAQTASQVALPSYAPPVTRATGGGLVLPESTGLKTPTGAESLHVTPSGLVVTGGLPALADQTASIETRIKGRRVSAADLFAAARDLEIAYARAGYLLVRVSLPPQTLNDGKPLRLTVTDGYVEKVDASTLDPRTRARVEAVLAPLVGQKGLTRGELERRLLLAGDIPGVKLHSTLAPGTSPGATELHLDGTYKPVTFTLGADNSMSSRLGGWEATAGADFNNLLGLGEVGYLRLAGYPTFTSDGLFSDDPRNRQIVGGFTVPLGTNGFWLNGEFVDSRTHPTSDLSYTMPDHFQRFSGSLGYNWLRSRDMNTTSIIGFDVAEETQEIALDGSRVAFTKDRTRVLRLAQTGDLWLASSGYLSGRVGLSFGLDAFGARSGTVELPLSRDGAEPDFRKLEVSMTYTQGFADNGIGLKLAGKAQTSFGDPLVSSEQMTLSGFDWLSAYDSDTVVGDSGAALRAELNFPKLIPSIQSVPAEGLAISPYVFAAVGVAHLEQPTSLERATTRASSFGLGVQIGLSRKDTMEEAMVLEYAHGTATDEDAGNRFNLRLSARF